MWDQTLDALRQVEEQTGKKVWRSDNPLLGGPFAPAPSISMPA